MTDPAFPYLYELHQHTAGCSACGRGTPADTVRGLKAAGFSGMVLTNHFYWGNSGIDRNQDWSGFVAPYIEAYEQACAVAAGLDFDVLFGMEEGVGRGMEVLLYGITPQWLLDHPELRIPASGYEPLKRLLDSVHEIGGLVYQAHPFRDRDYIPKPISPLPWELLDGVEAFNAGNKPEENVLATAYAREHSLPVIAGSDAHTPDFPGRSGIASPHRLRSNDDLIALLKTQNYRLILP